MRRTPLTDENRQEMLEKFAITRLSRREVLTSREGSITTFLKKYRLLTILNEAVRAYFIVIC